MLVLGKIQKHLIQYKKKVFNKGQIKKTRVYSTASTKDSTLLLFWFTWRSLKANGIWTKHICFTQTRNSNFEVHFKLCLDVQFLWAEHWVDVEKKMWGLFFDLSGIMPWWKFQCPASICCFRNSRYFWEKLPSFEFVSMSQN